MNDWISELKQDVAAEEAQIQEAIKRDVQVFLCVIASLFFRRSNLFGQQRLLRRKNRSSQ